MRALSLVCLLGALAGAGCPNTDAAVFVEPTIGDANVTVSSGALGTNMKGSFELHLHLGARASGASTVNLESFTIVDANGNDAADLKLTSDMTLPVTVQPDSDVVITLSFDSGVNPLPASAKEALCSGPIEIQGAIDDSLQDTSTGVDSNAFSASCM